MWPFLFKIFTVNYLEQFAKSNLTKNFEKKRIAFK
jgi:hypothetical protein